MTKKRKDYWLKHIQHLCELSIKDKKNRYPWIIAAAETALTNGKKHWIDIVFGKKSLEAFKKSNE